MDKVIEALANKAKEAKTSLEALQFSQAANNVANAMCAAYGVERARKEQPDKQ